VKRHQRFNEDDDVFDKCRSRFAGEGEVRAERLSDLSSSSGRSNTTTEARIAAEKFVKITKL
jgi:hypothetical protein